jgi:membrane-associated phospholipid phosphatase
MDQALLAIIQQADFPPWLGALMLLFTYAGPALFPVLGIAQLLRGRKRLGIALLLTQTAALALTLVFQVLAQRPRPDPAFAALQPPHFPSFPSGHAALAFSGALLVCLALRKTRWRLLTCSAAVLIAASRVYLGVHYLSDVLAGALLGAGLGISAYGLAFRGGLHRDGLRWLIWLQVALLGVISWMAYLDFLPQSLLAWPYSDKTLHFVLFGLAAFWLGLWLPKSGVRLGNIRLPAAPLILAAVVILDELVQTTSPVRTADWVDLSADFAGILCFWWLSRRWAKSQTTPTPDPDRIYLLLDSDKIVE